MIETRRQSSDVLDKSILDEAQITEEGGMILDGGGQLIRLAELEGRRLKAPLSLITPNPGQPREYFDPAKMKETRASIVDQGQKVSMKVVPYVEKTTGNRRLFIIDGERRFRIIRELGQDSIDTEVQWALSEEEIFLLSLIINEGVAPHNPMERAKAYARLVQREKEKGIESAVADLARRLGISNQTIYNHLKLLELSPEIREMVAHGHIPPANVLHITTAQRRYGDKLNMVKLARYLVDHLERSQEELEGEQGERASARITADTVRAAVIKALRGRESQDAAADLNAQRAIYRFTASIASARSSAAVLEEADPGRVVRFLRRRGRGQPPEVVRDRVQALIDELGEALKLVVRAIQPDPLEMSDDKPSFPKYIKQNKTSFRHPLRQAIARILAESSEYCLLTVNNLALQFEVTASEVAGHLAPLSNELALIGLKLASYDVREKDERGKYDQRPGYRLEWDDSRPVESASVAHPAAPAPSRSMRVIVHRGGVGVILEEESTATAVPLAPRPAAPVPSPQPVASIIASRPIVPPASASVLRPTIPRQPAPASSCPVVAVLPGRRVLSGGPGNTYGGLVGETVVIIQRDDPRYFQYSPAMDLKPGEVLVEIVSRKRTVAKVHSSLLSPATAE